MPDLRMSRQFSSFVVFLLLLLAQSSAWAYGDPLRPGETISQHLTPAILQSLFPGADRLGEVSGNPPAAAVYKAGQPLGYIFSAWDVTQSRGFSDRPLVLLVGLTPAGRITGAKVVHHSEPIIYLGVRDEAFFRLADQFTGYDIKNGVDVVPWGHDSVSQRTAAGEPVTGKVDAIARATVSSILMSDAIVRGARIIARDRGILPANNRPHIDL
ncbi:MAG: FMN-binding protein, partial [Candidatus Eremiobacteraeota bacterium]|nr:FMN-binding protein [Candidatus Eremiobacteraeota bacterium]